MKLIQLQEQWQYGGWTSKPTLGPLDPPQYAIVDDNDHAWLLMFEWYLIRDNVGGYKYPYALVELKHGAALVTRVFTMQRVVMSLHGEKLRGPVYHRNRNKLDNRFENLTFNRREIIARSEEIKTYARSTE